MSERTYDKLAEMPVQVGAWQSSARTDETSGGGERVTTVFALAGDGHVGRGEDVTYDPALHESLEETPPAIDLDGANTLAEASARLDAVDLFPAGAPDRATYRHYRRWGLESALLDLALKQARTDLAGALDLEAEPVRFLVSTGLDDPPTVEPVSQWLDIDPSLRFKIDVTRPLPAAVREALVQTGAIEAIDLKGVYAEEVTLEDYDETPSWIGEPDPEPAFYADLLEAFPEALIEDPAVTARTRSVLEPVVDRLSWDAPVHSVEAFQARPLDVGWCNVKPSRFGTLERLLDFIDFARSVGLNLYGGGQFELSVGRGQLHALAGLFYPNGPNDVAPRGYNAPEPRAGLPTSPLSVPDRSPGFGWPSG